MIFEKMRKVGKKRREERKEEEEEGKTFGHRFVVQVVYTYSSVFRV